MLEICTVLTWAPLKILRLEEGLFNVFIGGGDFVPSNPLALLYLLTPAWALYLLTSVLKCSL